MMTNVYMDSCRVCYMRIHGEEVQTQLEPLLQADHLLLWILSGTWRAWVEENEYALRGAFLLYKNVREELKLEPGEDREKARLFAVAIWGEIPTFPDYMHDDNLYENMAQRPLGKHNVFNRMQTRRMNIGWPMWDLQTMYASTLDEQIKKELVMKLSYYLLTLMRNEWININMSKVTLSSAQKIKAYVDEHITEELSTKELGQLFFLSPNHLMTVFKKEMGITLRQYIINRRVEMANGLIEHGTPVTEVAGLVGYKSYQGFYQVYQQAMNMSPAEYARKNR